MTVEIHIEELVLRGVAAADVATVTAALCDRLTALAGGGTEGLTTFDGTTVAHRPRPVPASGPAGLGTDAATAIWDAATGHGR